MVSADTADRSVKAAEGVARPAQTSSATRLAEFRARGQENLFKRLTVDAFPLQARHDLAGGRNHEGVDADRFAFEHSGGRAKIRQFAARTRADVGTIEFCAPNFRNIRPVVATVRLGNHRLQLADLL